MTTDTTLLRWPHGPTGFEKRFGNMTTRVVVAVILIPAVIFLVSAGGIGFGVLLALIGGGALFEFYSMSRAAGLSPQSGIATPGGVAILFVWGLLLGGVNDGPVPVGRALEICGVMFPVVLFLLIAGTSLTRPNEGALRNLGVTLGGLFFVLLPFISLTLGLSQFDLGVVEMTGSETAVRQVPGFLQNGTPNHIFLFVLVLLSTVWICDTFAYFGGRALGRHKLLARVSPGKTWEGAIAGALGGTIWMVLAMQYCFMGVPVILSVSLGVIVSTVGQISDLVESRLKRSCGVKDSSQLIPGHGGVLDRIDSFILVFPSVWVFVTLVNAF